jgi:hypothetical protein
MTMMYLINKELRSINQSIDKKIVRGASYEREAKRHKDLVKKLRRIESEAAYARTLAFLF